MELQQQEDGGTVNMNDLLPGSQTYGSSSHQQSKNEFTFGGGGSSPPTPLHSDDQNPIRGGLQIINNLVQRYNVFAHATPSSSASSDPPFAELSSAGYRHSLSVTGSTCGGGFLLSLPQNFFLPCAVAVLVLMRTTPTPS